MNRCGAAAVHSFSLTNEPPPERNLRRRDVLQFTVLQASSLRETLLISSTCEIAGNIFFFSQKVKPIERHLLSIRIIKLELFSLNYCTQNYLTGRQYGNTSIHIRRRATRPLFQLIIEIFGGFRSPDSSII